MIRTAGRSLVYAFSAIRGASCCAALAQVDRYRYRNLDTEFHDLAPFLGTLQILDVLDLRRVPYHSADKIYDPAKILRKWRSCLKQRNDVDNKEVADSSCGLSILSRQMLVVCD